MPLVARQRSRTVDTANALPVRIDLEPFADFAHLELLENPYVPVGQCLNPGCSCVFTPSRSWQRYCSNACRRFGDQEFRKIGMQAAPALLAHRLGKYENKAQSLRALSNAGRRYLGQLQSEWLKDRNRRQTLRGLVK